MTADHVPPGASFDPTAAGAGTLPRAWVRLWRAAPDRPQLHDPVRGWLSRGDLARESARVAGRLARAGLAAGDRVLFSAGSSAARVVAHVACLRLGAVALPANPAYGEAELLGLVSDARPRAAVVEGAQPGEWLRARGLLVVGPEVDLPDAPPPALDAAPPEAPALIGYTSGTTGRPKGAVLSHANLLAGAEALRLAWRWSESDRLLLALPLFHMHGLGVGVHGTLHAGGSAVLLPRFDPDALFDASGAHAATLFFGVPTHYHRLAAHPRAAELRSLRLCVSGSAPLAADLHRRVEAASGQLVLERYGMTETVMLASNPCEGERRPGTVGLPLPGVELRLASGSGEIEVRGPSVFSGYWERPEATREAFTPDGFFRTGDLGALDEAGYLAIRGRAKELVISGGYNVHPREVEDALADHPALVEVAVVGEPSAEWGERVAAYVVARAPVTCDGLRAFLAGRLAPYKHPRVLHRVDALPRNALGKLQRHRLRGGRVEPE